MTKHLLQEFLPKSTILLSFVAMDETRLQTLLDDCQEVLRPKSALKARVLVPFSFGVPDEDPVRCSSYVYSYSTGQRLVSRFFVLIFIYYKSPQPCISVEGLAFFRNFSTPRLAVSS